MKVYFEASITVPDGTPIEDVEDFLRFELGITSHLHPSSLTEHDLDNYSPADFYIKRWSQA